MSAPPVYTFQRGEPVVYGLRAKEGDPTDYTVTAKLKPLANAAVSVPDDSVAVVATFIVSFVAQAGAVAAYWLMSLTAAQSAALPAGRYIADEKLSFGGVPVNITDPVIIVLKNSVSG
jgi:hypothetical protein